MTKNDCILVWVLRIIGTNSLFALFCVAFPYSWMNAIHQWLGMGELPSAPIVGYLARSTSLFYALMGGLLWVISFDLGRHRKVLCYLGGAFIVFGLILTVVDFAERLPLSWSLWEGPFDAAAGFLILWLSYRVKSETRSK